jgi:hypothetical protein
MFIILNNPSLGEIGIETDDIFAIYRTNGVVLDHKTMSPECYAILMRPYHKDHYFLLSDENGKKLIEFLKKDRNAIII